MSVGRPHPWSASLLVACVACAGCPPAPEGPPDASGPQVTCDGDPLSESFLRGVIDRLADTAWEGRRFDSDGLVQATAWTRNQFACVGLTPGAPSLPGLPSAAFEQPFSTTGDEIDPPTDILDYAYDPDRTYPFTNVIGSLPGKGALADEVVVVGAHLDHLGRSGKQGGAMVLGADDDASGIAAVLGVAKSLAAAPRAENRRTLVFVAWGVEEDPFYVRGSQAFFSAMTNGAKAKIVHYVNFDMIGRYVDHGAVYAMGTYEGSPARMILERIADEDPDLNVELGERGAASDQETFCVAGIPYVFFFTDDDCYHRPCDTPDRIDGPHLARIVTHAAKLIDALGTEPGLADAKAAFPDAYAAAWDGLACTDQD